MERQLKNDILEEISLYDLEGNISIIADKIEEIKNHSKNYDKITLGADIDYDSEEGYVILVFKGQRLENDNEYDRRLALEAKKELRKILVKNNENIKIK